MTETTMSLALEEFGCGLLLLNEIAALQGWLKAHDISWDEQEARARFTTAIRTLLVRGLARLNPNGTLELDDQLACILRVIAHPCYSLSLARVDAQRAQHCAYHIDGTHIVRQAWQHEGGYVLAKVALSCQYLIAQAVEFFQITSAPTIEGSWELPLDQLEAIQTAEGLPDTIRAWLSEDYQHERMRGSLSRVERVGDSLISDYACLILRGLERNWLFRLMPQEGRVRLRLASQEALEEELALLIKRRYC